MLASRRVSHEHDLAVAKLGRLVFFDISQASGDFVRVSVEVSKTP